MRSGHIARVTAAAAMAAGLFCAGSPAFAQTGAIADSTAATMRIHESPAAYFGSLPAMPADSLAAKADALIEASAEGSRGAVAMAAFDYFSNSPVMGHDAVAVHVADKWFLSKTLEWPDAATYPLLYAYAEFNRNSLIGMSAPGLKMEGLDGKTYDVREFVNRNKVLYFYDDQCLTCLKQSRELADFAKGYKGPTLYIYAVNTGSDPLAWIRYVRENFALVGDNPDVRWINLSDPSDSNDFKRKYGLITTPGMFLINNQNIIEGRKLDVEALAALLDVQRSTRGTLSRTIAKIFDEVSPQSAEEILAVAEAFAQKCGEDRPLYRESIYAIYSYLRNEMPLTYQEGAVAVADRYILGRPDMWSDEFRAQIEEALARYRLNPLGEKATDLTLQNENGDDVRMLKGCAPRTLLFFHIVGCGDCRREHALLREKAEFLHSHNVRVVYIYLGFSESEWKGYIETNRDLEKMGWVFLRDAKGESGVREKYDVQYVPRMYLLDRKKRIIAKDIDSIMLFSESGLF